MLLAHSTSGGTTRPTSRAPGSRGGSRPFAWCPRVFRWPDGWVLLTKDKRIRYRAEELEALQEGHLFCLVSGNLDIDAMTQTFLDALPKIERVAGQDPVGFWHVYRNGKIKRMWP